MSPNACRSVVEIDLLGTYHVLRAGYEFLRKPGSVVINISAPQAFLPWALQSHVCAAKAGVDMLTRVLAIEWGAHGVRVNGVVPGPIEAPREWRDWHPHRRPENGGWSLGGATTAWAAITAQ